MTTLRYQVITPGASHTRLDEGEAVWLAGHLARSSDWVEVVRYYQVDDFEEGLVTNSEVILRLPTQHPGDQR